MWASFIAALEYLARTWNISRDSEKQSLQHKIIMLDVSLSIEKQFPVGSRYCDVKSLCDMKRLRMIYYNK